jgi:hypothetical protein
MTDQRAAVASQVLRRQQNLLGSGFYSEVSRMQYAGPKGEQPWTSTAAAAVAAAAAAAGLGLCQPANWTNTSNTQ